MWSPNKLGRRSSANSEEAKVKVRQNSSDRIACMDEYMRQGTELTIETSGSDEQQALEATLALIKDGFGEPE